MLIRKSSVFLTVVMAGAVASGFAETTASLRRVVATAAEKTGMWADAAVAGNDATTVIQAQLDACSDGDTVVLKPGLYVLTNHLNLTTSGVTLRSDDGMGRLARKTTLLYRPETSTNRLVRIASARTTVWGVTLTNGWVDASQGGGACLDNCGANSGLRSCDVVGCTSWHQAWVSAGSGVGGFEGAGGGVYIYKSGVVSNCLIRANTGFTGGGVYMNGGPDGLADPTAVPRVTDSEITENNLTGRGYYDKRGSGSAVFAYQAAYLDGCHIASNTCNTALTRYRTVAGWKGGIVVSNCFFTANNGGTTDGWAEVGYVSCVTDCTFFREGRHVAGDVSDFSGNQVFSCKLTGDKDMGIVRVENVRNCLFVGNEKSCMGVGKSRNMAENCTFIGNVGCVYSSGSGKDSPVASRTNRVVNCIFYDNANDLYGANQGNAEPNAFFVSNCCIRTKSFDMTGGRKFGLLDGTNTCYTFDEKLLAEYEAKVIKFVDAANGNYRLQRKSLLRDAGMKLGWMTGATDLDGKPRCLNGNGKASADALPDVGCYECAIGTPGMALLVQ